MGVDISSIIEGRELEMIELSGKHISMDAYNIMFQFISIIRDRMTGEPLRDSHGNITSHLSGLMYRNTRFIEAGIKPIYVFDGKPAVNVISVGLQVLLGLFGHCDSIYD